MQIFRTTSTAAILAMLVMVPSALADDTTGGASPGDPAPPVISTPTTPTVAGSRVVIKGGLAYAPAAAPLSIKKVIWAGNKIRSLPYIWGGGHAAWLARGYDCSGSVSFALHGGGLIRQTMVSGELASFGDRGKGQWITVFANGGHVFMVVAGARFDTSGASSARSRWQKNMRSGSGYAVRHPRGL
ncbi:MAG: hypothetical protein F2799_06110 [Actinobacteria bacterium]|uniref:Unannotated protein n=1 Tax=freshwater metagenome TaxID=449393 RepID=A0A6J7ECU5_9ZZZZ|nr:hypothetical protein [Actinomycetota bacterium]